MWTDGINKVRAGITSLEEVRRVLARCPGGIPASQYAEETVLSGAEGLPA